MAYQPIAAELKVKATRIALLDLVKIRTNCEGVQGGNGVRIDSVLKELQEIGSILELGTDFLESWPTIIVSELNALLDNCISNGNALMVQRNDAAFAQFLQAVQQSLAMLYRTGVKLSVSLGPKVQQLTTEADAHVASLKAADDRAADLIKRVGALVDPVSSRNLSLAFHDRKKFINELRNNWLIAIVVVSTVAIGITCFSAYEFLEIAPDKLSIFIATRLAVVVPFLLADAFLVSQYLHERRVEEAYAHRASVASTIHVFSELLEDGETKAAVLRGVSELLLRDPYASSASPKWQLGKGHLAEIRKLVEAVLKDERTSSRK